jgi:cystathionine gamma-synthase
VEAVYYPGLPDHPDHELAKKQMRGFGGMVSVSFNGGEAAARKVAENTTIFTLAESLGGIESLVNYPSEMTHASVKGTELEVPANLIRLSVGIEDTEDLIADLEQAFKQL